MKWLLILGVLPALILGSARAATLRGVVVSDELDGPPLSRVVIRAQGAGDAPTDGLGRFALTIPRAKAGERIRLEIVLPGYVPVNSTQLDVTLLADETATAPTIVLTQEPIRDEMTRRFYRSACWVATLERARLAPSNTPANVGPSTQNFSERDRDLALRASGTMAVQFANVPEAAMSTVYRSALNLFLEGQIADSLGLLAGPGLLEWPRTTESGAAQFVEACLLKARILTTQCRFPEARTAYHVATSEAPASHSAWLGLALFEQGAQQYEVSLQAFQRAVALARASSRPELIAATLVASGHIHRDQDRWDEAQKVWLEALALYRGSSTNAASRHLPEVAGTLNDLATLDMDLGRVPSARASFGEALEVLLPLEKAFPMAYSPMVAALRSNLGILSSLGGKPDDARLLFEQALGAQRLQTKYCPSPCCVDLARTLFNLGLLEHRQKQLARARAAYTEALAIYRQLAQDQPVTYTADLGDTLNNLGMLQREERRLPEATQSLRGALAAYRAASRNHPERFRNSIERVEARLLELDRAATAPSSGSGAPRDQ